MQQRNSNTHSRAIGSVWRPLLSGHNHLMSFLSAYLPALLR